MLRSLLLRRLETAAGKTIKKNIASRIVLNALFNKMKTPTLLSEACLRAVQSPKEVSAESKI
jgi:hypothetical protein